MIRKYLNGYSELEIKDICIEKFYDNVLVIPAYREGALFINNLLNLSKVVGEPTLCIIVVNEPPDATSGAKAINCQLINDLKNLGSSDQNQKFSIVEMRNLTLLILGPIAIEKKMGVGRARKIGADLALSLIESGYVRHPIIFNTDADAELPQDYFENVKKLRNDKTIAGFVYPFIHSTPNNRKQKSAIAIYELFLRQYVAGLCWAGSPYAFHTVGSTIAVDANAYAKVRGFNRIAAGEDFYLLNKLKKVGEIRSIIGAPIKLSARISTRVPFGTGPALHRILQFDDVLVAPIFYHPSVFDHVRFLLRHVGYAFDISSMPNSYIDDGIADPRLIKKLALSLKGASQLCHHLAQRKGQVDKAFHDWFDAFKTLKFIHAVRDAGFPMQSYQDLFADKIHSFSPGLGEGHAPLLL